MPANILNWGIELILSLQAAIGVWAVRPLNFFTSLGYQEFFMLFLPLIYWCWDSVLGVRVGIALFLSIGVNDLFKMGFNDPRPYWYDTRVDLLADPEPAFGLPSGHAQNAVVLWSVLAAHLRKNWAWAVAGALAFLIGFSRIYLGAHFPTDVIVGWLIGIVLLYAFLRLEKRIWEAFKKYSAGKQVVVLLVVALAMIVASIATVAVVRSTFEVPDEWALNALAANEEAEINPLTISVMITTMAVIFGMLAGVVWLGQRGGFDARGLAWKRIARYVIGMVVLLAIYLGLDVLFSMLAEDETTLGYLLRFVRYGLLGLWVGGLGPAVFVRFGLADKAQGVAAP